MKAVQPAPAAHTMTAACCEPELLGFERQNSRATGHPHVPAFFVYADAVRVLDSWSNIQGKSDEN